MADVYDLSSHSRLMHRTAPTLVHQGGSWRFFARGRDGDWYRTTIASTPELAAVIARASSGVRLDELEADLLALDLELDASDVHEYVQALVDAQLLVAETTAETGEASVASSALAASEVARVWETVRVLHRLGNDGDALLAFREAFAMRWGDEEVPLLIALDDATSFTIEPARSAHPALVRALERAYCERLPEIVLTDATIAALATADPPPLPRSMRALVLVDPSSGQVHVERVDAHADHHPNAIAMNIDSLELSDLLLLLHDEQLVLRSRRFGHEVVPVPPARLAAAESPVIGFVRALAAQAVASPMGWRWGALAAAAFLPRVVAGAHLLARARWRLDGDARAALDCMDGHGLRAITGMPRWVAVAEPFECSVDLADPDAVAALARRAAGMRELVLVEQTPAAVWQVVTLTDDSAPAPRPLAALPRPTRRDRTFVPGDDYLQLSLLVPPVDFDRALTELVAPVVARGIADRWYFSRHLSRDGHLRVRFFGHGPRLLGEAYADLRHEAAPWLEGGRVREIAIETMQREIERWGGLDAIVLAEQIFCADSDAVLALVADRACDDRSSLALRSLDVLLADLGFDGSDRRSLLTAQCADFARRVRGTPKALDEADARANLPSATAVLARRTSRIAPLTRELRALEARGRLSRPFGAIAASYLHMAMNRIMAVPDLEQEFAIYRHLAGDAG